MPISISPSLYAIRVKSDGKYSAMFGYINRTTEVIERAAGNRNTFYGYPGAPQPPTTFEVGRHIPAVEVDLVPEKLKCVYVLDSTATASTPVFPPSVGVESVSPADPDSGLRTVVFTVVNPHNQSVFADGDANEVSFGEGQPTYFSPGTTRWTVEVPTGLEVTWRVGTISATVQA